MGRRYAFPSPFHLRRLLTVLKPVLSPPATQSNSGDQTGAERDERGGLRYRRLLRRVDRDGVDPDVVGVVEVVGEHIPKREIGGGRSSEASNRCSVRRPCSGISAGNQRRVDVQ